jgi:uncharacterized membrane protein
VSGAGEFDARGVELLTFFGWPVLAVAVLFVISGLVMSLRGLHTFLDRRQRALLSLLRIAAAIAVLAILFEPAIVYKKISRVRSRVAVMMDRSRSMSLPSAPGGTPRFEDAVSWLRGSRPALEALSSMYVLDFHLFDTESFQTSPSAVLEGNPGAPAGSGTDMLRSLDGILSGELPLSGIVMLTDGADRGELERSFDPEKNTLAPQTRSFLARAGVPVHVFIPGREGAVRDVAVTSLDVPAVAFAGVETEVTASITAAGLDGMELPVLLREGNAPAQSRTLKIVSGRTSYRVAFRFVPASAVDEVVSVSVPAVAGEITSSNNTGYSVLKVARDKVRVLHVAGGPSWDVRFLRQYFKHTPGLDLISFFILRTHESRVNAPDDELSLIPFPTDEVFSEHLSSFDAVFFQDFNFSPYGMRGYLPGLAAYVAGGGGLMIAGGNRSLSTGEYRASELDPLLPLVLATGDAAVSTDPFQPVLSEAGGRHPITRLAADPGGSAAIWKAAQQLNGVNMAQGVRDGAQVLLEHPFRKMSDGRAAPVLAVWEYGRGRVALMMTDESWRWGFGDAAYGESRIYSRFYENMLKWLSGDPAYRRLVLDPVAEAAHGGPPLVTGRVLGPDYAEDASGKVRITVSREGSVPFSSEIAAGKGGRFSVPLPGVSPGVYDVEIAAPGGAGGPASLRREVLAAAPDPELADAAPNDPLMKALAAATGGGLHYMSQGGLGALNFPDRSQELVNRKEYRRLFDRAWVIALIAALLAAEWALRRRWGQQ